MSLEKFPKISELIELSLFWKRNLEHNLKYDQDLLNKVINMLTDSEILKYLVYVHFFWNSQYLKNEELPNQGNEQHSDMIYRLILIKCWLLTEV